MDEEALYNIHNKNLMKRATTTFMGILEGLIADETIVSSEVAFLSEWLKLNKDAADKWPMSEVQLAINSAMSDNELCAEDLHNIKDVIRRIVPPLRRIEEGAAIPSAPWDKDESVILANMTCVLSGNFQILPRQEIEQILKFKGATIQPNVTKKIKYLFVDYSENTYWKQGSFGTKIEKAIEIREQTGIKILTEETLFNSISQDR